MPKVSVIIPIYNVEEYLKECLDSVINQTLENIEIICVNDGSPDNSHLILAEYAKKDNRIIILNQQNLGLPISRNNGMKIAKGEYIFFLDSDDYLFDNSVLENLYKNAKENDLDFLHSNCHMFCAEENETQENRLRGHISFFTYEEKINFRIDAKNYQYIIDNYPCTSWGCLYKTSFIKENNLEFIKQKTIHEDNGFFLKLLSAFPKTSFINDISIAYRIRSSSIMGQNNKRQSLQKMKTVINDVFQYIKNQIEKETANELMKKIKCSNRYYKLFDKGIRGICTYNWCHQNKTIKIFGIPVFRERIKKKKLVRKVLGIPIYKGNIKK